MIKIKKEIIAVIAVFALAVSPAYAADAKDGEEGYYEHVKKMMDEVTGDLGLTQEQMTRIAAERSKVWEAKKEIRSRIKEKKKALKEELRKSEIDKVKVDQLVAEITGLHGTKLKNHVDSLMTVRAILTPEQFSMFQEKMETKKEQWREQFKHRFGHEPGE